MKRAELEEVILKKLNKGKFDGQVGGDFPARMVTYRRLIKNGIPQFVSIRQGEPEVIDRKYETKEEKLEFLRSAGWMMSDPDVNMYNRLYKNKLQNRE